jgi:hypothetical protein
MKYGNFVETRELIKQKLLLQKAAYPYSEKDAKKIGKKIGATKEEISKLAQGMNVEHEHDKDSATNVAHGDPKIVAKIALAHLREMIDYYDKLETIEKALNPSYFKTYVAAYNDFSRLGNDDLLNNLDTLQDQYLEATGIDAGYANQVLDQIKKTVVPVAKQYNQLWDKYSQVIAAPRLIQFGLGRLDENDFNNPLQLAQGHFRQYGKALGNFKNFLSSQLTQPQEGFAKADLYETQPGETLLDVMHRVLKFQSEHPAQPQPTVTPQDKNRHAIMTHIHSLRETPETESPFVGGDDYNKALPPLHHQAILSQLEGQNEDELLASGVLGDKLGEGLFRRVYSLKQYPGLVVKVPKGTMGFNNNVAEYKHYKHYKDSGAKKYFAPIYGITSNGLSLAKKVYKVPEDIAEDIDFSFVISNPRHDKRLNTIAGNLGVGDLHSGNFGINRGKLVALDYNKAVPDPLDIGKDVELADQSLEHLNPDFSEMILSLIDRARDFGLELYIREGFRTRARQQYLSDTVNAQGAGVAPPIYTEEGMIDFDERVFPHGAGFATDIGIKGFENNEDPYHEFLHRLWAAMFPGQVNPNPIPNDFNHYEASKEFIDKNSRDLTESENYDSFVDIFSKAGPGRRAIAGKSRAWGDILNHYIRDIHTPGLSDRNTIPIDKYQRILANAISYHIRNHRPGAHEYEERTPEEKQKRTSLYTNILAGHGVNDDYLADLDPAHSTKTQALKKFVDETNWSSRDDLEKLERNITRLNSAPALTASQPSLTQPAASMSAPSHPPGALPISQFLVRNQTQPRWAAQPVSTQPIVSQDLLDKLTSNPPSGSDFVDANKQYWNATFAKPVKALASGVESLGKKMHVIKASYIDTIKQTTAQNPYEQVGLSQDRISSLIDSLLKIKQLSSAPSTPENTTTTSDIVKDPYDQAGLDKKRISSLVSSLLKIPPLSRPTQTPSAPSAAPDINSTIQQAEQAHTVQPKFMPTRAYNRFKTSQDRSKFAVGLAPLSQSRVMESINTSNAQRRERERFDDVLQRDTQSTLQGDSDRMSGPEFRGKIGFLDRFMKRTQPVQGTVLGAPQSSGGSQVVADIYSPHGTRTTQEIEAENAKLYQGVNDLASKSEIAFDQ